MLKVNCITCKLEEIEDNYHCWCLAPKADRVLRDVLILDTIEGFRTPLGYAGGLHDNLTVLDALKEAGFIYISSNLRDKDWGLILHLLKTVK